MAGNLPEELSLEGELTISVYQEETPLVRLTLRDMGSRRRFAEVELPMEVFAAAVMRSRIVPCRIKAPQDPRIGKVLQTKHEAVLLNPKGAFYTSDELLATLLEPLEINGWVGDLSDLKNPHRHYQSADRWYAKVLFRRWVDKDTLEVPEVAREQEPPVPLNALELQRVEQYVHEGLDLSEAIRKVRREVIESISDSEEE